MIGCWLVASASDWLLVTELVARLRVRGQWEAGRREAGGETENYGCNLVENKIQLISDHSTVNSDSSKYPNTREGGTLPSLPWLHWLHWPPATTFDSSGSPQQWVDWRFLNSVTALTGSLRTLWCCLIWKLCCINSISAVIQSGLRSCGTSLSLDLSRQIISRYLTFETNRKSLQQNYIQSGKLNKALR